MVMLMRDSVRLTAEQTEAINEIEHNLQIIACAGSGKTEVITRRIAHILNSRPEIQPEHIVAFTFTEKAAASMKSRIVHAMDGRDIYEMYIGTIHSFCYNLLSRYTEDFAQKKILDTVKSHLFVARYHAECGMDDLGLTVYPRNVNLFLSCIEKMIDDYDHQEHWEEKNRIVFEKYRSSVYDHGYIDFALLIFETINQIRNNVALQEYLKKIRYLVVDEYQDIDDLQEKLIALIANAGANICVVGDDDQTIYQFRGSNANNMISFSERYADVHQVRLEKNFRCAPGIVDVADNVICNNSHRIRKKMISQHKNTNSIVSAQRYDDKQEQYAAIRDQIVSLYQKQVPYREMAILVRKGKYINPIAAVLDNAGIPFSTDSADHFFNGNYFGRFISTLQNLTDIDKAKLYECWHDLVDDRAFRVGFRYLRSCARGGQVNTLHEILEAFCEKIGFLNTECDDLEQRRIHLNGIFKILDDYDEIYGDWQLTARISGILKFLGTQAAEEYKYHSFKPENPNEDAVQIMTVHKAKGLEFHTVFLPELERREFPVSNMGGKQYWHVLGGVFEQQKDKYFSDLEDERKLFYVAITRAKQNLYITYELTTQPVSCFVREAATSSNLQINRSDLTYNPKVDDDFSTALKLSDQREPKNKKVGCRQRQEYWETVKYAKRQLYDYYGTACHFFPEAHADLIRIKSMSPDEILEDATRNGLI